ncbi:uncharacterized protein LOC131056757 [Cryptomeria japonica]|uniref:uncharacterized protein LOC131056757 n=1 Tax=Cryptomeria japonica TaxID=3369 RepID=UPI0027DA3DD9|nr:uncharacterized protein LOC131056757 [Cryptomeria japonica]
MTKWLAPNPSWPKLNFDGSAQNTWQARGGVIHDHQGTTIAAYASSLKNHNVTQAEGMALLWGLKFTTAIGIRQLEIEGDSKVIMEVDSGRSVVGWKVKSIWRDARMFMANLDCFTVRHIFKEGNATAHSMVVVGRLQDGLRCWRNTDLLPVITKEILEKEKTKS